MPAGYILTRDQMGLEVTPDQDAACIALERQGLRFLVDFGTANAEHILQYQSYRQVSDHLTLSANDRQWLKDNRIAP